MDGEREMAAGKGGAIKFEQEKRKERGGNFQSFHVASNTTEEASTCADFHYPYNITIFHFHLLTVNFSVDLVRVAGAPVPAVDDGGRAGRAAGQELLLRPGAHGRGPVGRPLLQAAEVHRVAQHAQRVAPT